MKNETLSVFIGRFQPAHMGHFHIIKTALETTDKLLILIGSSYKPPSAKNPFSYDERMILIDRLLRDNGISTDRISFEPIMDHMYNDNAWASDIADAVYRHNDNDEDIRLIGHEKDHSSFYLKMFPQWKSISVETYQNLNATDVRFELYKDAPHNSMFYKKAFGAAYMALYEMVLSCPNFQKAREEHEFIQGYKKSWECAPFPPIFVTVDALVECSNHIIVIKRNGDPGKGLFALPGGFVDGGSLLDNSIRELREETKLKVPVPVLRGSLLNSTVFDHPDRSQRGRTITHCFHFKLRDELKLPKVKGSDDAIEAFWLPISEVKYMSEVFFEDHHDICKKILGLS